MDGTLVRYHPEAYDRVLAEGPAKERKLTEDTLAGLRFVRNRIGQDVDHVDFIHLRSGRPGPAGRITDWRWQPLPELTFDSLSPRGQAWEMARYLAYQDQLADHTVGETFARAASFLKRAAARSPVDPEHAGGARSCRRRAPEAGRLGRP